MSALDMLRRPADPKPFDAVIAEIRDALEALDFTNENAELVRLQAEIDAARQAIDTARQRAAQIGKEEREGSAERSAGRAVADALLSGDDPDEAATASTAAGTLVDRKAALVAAIPQLAEQMTRAKARMSEIRHEAERQVRKTMCPLVEVLMTQAREAAGQMVEVYASLAAVSSVAGSVQNEDRALGTVIRALSDKNVLPRGRGDIPVPAAINRLQESLEGKGMAFPLKFGVASKIGWPVNPHPLLHQHARY